MADPPVDEEAVFLAALEIKTYAGRMAYVEQACAGNVELHSRVLKLLKSHDESQGPFDAAPPGLQPTNITHQCSAAGDQIGPYKLLEQIGEGGFGIVYMADQQAPVRRRVALKIVKPGMDTKQVLARFKAELQALSLMDHPNIARVLDGGSTDTGRPYFVMELVRGVPITEYCDQNNLDVRQRLDLFVTVCHAVQHAHQKGIIHRDIKPSNVLVTMNDGRPIPKVIDFGVAKAINQQLTPETIFTRFAEMIGTPLYMSPEQAEMTSLDIDTRSDIYSLGVLLYELLTGTTPFEKERLKQAAFDEIRRIIREEEPAKPSTRISTLGANSAAIAAHRHVEPGRLGQLMRGDLDWIVMKALEKDRTRRYETANGFAMDIQRHLANEPVSASPPSAAYRFRKFARRNRTALAMAAVVAVALLLGIVGTAWQALQAMHERDEAYAARVAEGIQHAKAEENLQKARHAVDEYFTLVSESKLLDVPGLQPLRKELLEAALRYYEEFAQEHTSDPQVLADLAVTHLRVAEVYLAIERTDDSLASCARALDVIDRLRRDYPSAVKEHCRLAGYWKGARPAHKDTDPEPSDGEAALKLLNRMCATWQTLAEENPSEFGFQSDLAAIYAHLGMLLDWHRTKDAAVYFEKAQHTLETLVRRFPAEPQYRADLARVNESLVGTYRRSSRPADSESAAHRSRELCDQLVAEFPKVPQYRVELTTNLVELGNIEVLRNPKIGIAAFRRAADLTKGLIEEFPSVPRYHSLLTGITNDVFNKAQQAGPHQPECEKLYRELIPVVTELTPKNPERVAEVWQRATASNFMELGSLLEKGGQPQEAATAYRQGIDILEKLVAGHPADRSSRQLLASIYQSARSVLSAAGQTQEATTILNRQIETLRHLADRHPADASIRHDLGSALRDLGRLDEAEASLRKAIELDPTMPWTNQELGHVLRDRGKLEEAAASYRKESENDPRRPWAHHELGGVLRRLGRLQEAEDAFRAEIAIKPDQYWSLIALADVLVDRGNSTEATACFRKVIEINPQDEGALQRARSFLLAHGDSRAAETAYRDALTLWKKRVAESPSNREYRWHLAGSHQELAGLLSGTGRKADAEAQRREALALWENLVAEAPTNIDYRWHLAVAHDELGNLLKDAGRLQEAADSFRSALPLWEKLSAETQSDDHRLHLSWTRAWLTDVLLPQGKHAEVAKLAIESAHASPDKLDSLRAAVHLEQCAALAKQDASLTPAELKAVIDSYTNQAVELMREAGKRPTGNGRLENQLAWQLATNPKPELRIPARAVELAKKAVELDPQSGMIWNTLGVAQYRAGDWKSAIAALEKSMELRNGGDSADWYFLGMCHWQQGQKDRAKMWYDAARLWTTRLAPQNDELVRFQTEAATLLGLPQDVSPSDTDDLAAANALVDLAPQASSFELRGTVHAEQRAWARAADDFAKAIELGNKSYLAWYDQALVRRAQNDKPAYQAACADMLKRFAQTDDGATAHFVAWTCALGPDALTDFAPAIALAETAAKKNEKSAQFANGLGAILYRAGRFDEARQKLEEADRLDPAAVPRASSPVYTWLFLAMTHHRLGHADAAKQWLDKARQETDKVLKEHGAGTAKLTWNRRLTLNLLRREAEELLGVNQPPAPPAAAKPANAAAPVEAAKP